MLDQPEPAFDAAAPFGTRFCEFMTMTRFTDGRWTEDKAVPVTSLSLHPGAHVLHYAGTCFEGVKAFRMPDSGIRIFRLDRHLAILLVGVA